MQHNWGKGYGRKGRHFDHNGGRGHGNNNEERGQMNQQNKTGVDEIVIVHIVQMLNVTIAINMDTMQRSVMPRKEWKKMQI